MCVYYCVCFNWNFCRLLYIEPRHRRVNNSSVFIKRRTSTALDFPRFSTMLQLSRESATTVSRFAPKPSVEPNTSQRRYGKGQKSGGKMKSSEASEPTTGKWGRKIEPIIPYAC